MRPAKHDGAFARNPQRLVGTVHRRARRVWGGVEHAVGLEFSRGFCQRAAARGTADRSRRKRCAGDEAQQGSKAFDGIGADKMQLRHARLKSGAQQWRAVRTGDFFQQRRRQDAEPRDVDPVTRSEDNVVVCSRAILEIEHHAIGQRACAGIAPAGVHVTLANRGFSHPAAPGFRQRRVNSSRRLGGQMAHQARQLRRASSTGRVRLRTAT